MAITVVLNGAGNDAAVLETAMRFAAQERCLLRVCLGVQGDVELVEKQLDIARWYLTTHQGLTAPEYVIERRTQSTDSVRADELNLTGGDLWA